MEEYSKYVYDVCHDVEGMEYLLEEEWYNDSEADVIGYTVTDYEATRLYHFKFNGWNFRIQVHK